MTYATSRKTALILMALFAGCLVVQAILPQRGTVSPEHYTLWRLRYPVLAQSAEALGLDRVSSMPWFWALGFALTTSLALSTLRRATRLIRDGLTQRGEEFALDLAEAPGVLSHMAHALRRQGYRVTVTNDSLVAQRGTLGVWGSIAFHGGLVVLFIGVLISAATRFTGFVELAPGQVFRETDGSVAQRGAPQSQDHSSLLVEVREVGVVFWPDGSVRDIWAYVIAQDGPGAFAEGRLRRNQPLRAGSSTVNLASAFGPAAHLRYTSSDGQTQEGYLHFGMENAVPSNTFFLPGTDLTVTAELSGPWRESLEGSQTAAPVLSLTAQEGDASKDLRRITVGDSLPVAEGLLEFVALEAWALFMVKRDAGFLVLLAGGLLAIMGLALAVFIIPRWVRVFLEEGRWRCVAQTSVGGAAFQREIMRLATVAGEGHHD